MSEERGVALRPPMEMSVVESPVAIIARATEQANALMDVVEKRKLYTVISGKKYLGAEAWETICAFNNTSPVTAWVRPIEESGEVVGYEAKVELWKNGECIGGAIMPCGFDEFPCKGKEGSAKSKAAKSAAQTWALSKASRMKFSYVAVLAGFEPTPAEEMIEEQGVARDEVKPRGHYCSVHKTVWFKRGRMQNFAHPIKGTDGKDTGTWCNEPKEVADEAEEIPGEESVQAASTQAPKRRLATKGELIDSIDKGFDALDWDADKVDGFLAKYCGEGGLTDLTTIKLGQVVKELEQIAKEQKAEGEREELPY